MDELYCGHCFLYGIMFHLCDFGLLHCLWQWTYSDCWSFIVLKYVCRPFLPCAFTLCLELTRENAGERNPLLPLPSLALDFLWPTRHFECVVAHVQLLLYFLHHNNAPWGSNLYEARLLDVYIIHKLINKNRIPLPPILISHIRMWWPRRVDPLFSPFAYTGYGSIWCQLWG